MISVGNGCRIRADLREDSSGWDDRGTNLGNDDKDEAAQCDCERPFAQTLLVRRPEKTSPRAPSGRRIHRRCERESRPTSRSGGGEASLGEFQHMRETRGLWEHRAATRRGLAGMRGHSSGRNPDGSRGSGATAHAVPTLTLTRDLRLLFSYSAHPQSAG